MPGLAALLEGMSGHLPVIASNGPAMLPLVRCAGGLSWRSGHVEQRRGTDTHLALRATKTSRAMVSKCSAIPAETTPRTSSGTSI